MQRSHTSEARPDQKMGRRRGPHLTSTIRRMLKRTAAKKRRQRDRL